MIRAVHHVALRSPDPRAALAAYADAVGGDIETDATGAWLRGPNLFLRCEQGLAPLETAQVHAVGLAHVCVQGRDPTSIRARLEHGGVRYSSEPVALGTGFLYVYARDGQRRLLEVETAPFLPTAPPAWFAHMAFVVRDLDAMAGFYHRLLGGELRRGGRLQNNPRVDEVAGLRGVDVDVMWVVGRNLTLEFWRYHAPAIAPDARQNGYLHLALECDDVAAASALAVAAGAVADDAPLSTTRGATAAVLDPEGNRLLFVATNPHDREWRIDALPAPDILARVAEAREAARRTA